MSRCLGRPRQQVWQPHPAPSQTPSKNTGRFLPPHLDRQRDHQGYWFSRRLWEDIQKVQFFSRFRNHAPVSVRHIILAEVHWPIRWGFRQVLHHPWHGAPQLVERFGGREPLRRIIDGLLYYPAPNLDRERQVKYNPWAMVPLGNSCRWGYFEFPKVRLLLELILQHGHAKAGRFLVLDVFLEQCPGFRSAGGGMRPPLDHPLNVSSGPVGPALNWDATYGPILELATKRVIFCESHWSHQAEVLTYLICHQLVMVGTMRVPVTGVRLIRRLIFIVG